MCRGTGWWRMGQVAHKAKGWWYQEGLDDARAGHRSPLFETCWALSAFSLIL